MIWDAGYGAMSYSCFARSALIAAQIFFSNSFSFPRHPVMSSFFSEINPPSDANLASVKLGHGRAIFSVLRRWSFPSSVNFSSLRKGSPRKFSSSSFLKLARSLNDSSGILCPG